MLNTYASVEHRCQWNFLFKRKEKEKEKKFLELWIQGSLVWVFFFHGFVLQMSEFSHVWWVKFQPFTRQDSNRVSFLYQPGSFHRNKTIFWIPLCFLSEWIGVLQVVQKLWWKRCTQKHACWFPYFVKNWDKTPFDVVYSCRLPVWLNKIYQSCYSFLCTECSLHLYLPSCFILHISCTFSTDLELTSVNFLPSAFLTPSSPYNSFCKLN